MAANMITKMRDLGSSYDDDISEPHGGRYYDWLLQHGPDDEKGEFVLDTRGASVKVEQLLQDQELLKAMQMALESLGNYWLFKIGFDEDYLFRTRPSGP